MPYGEVRERGRFALPSFVQRYIGGTLVALGGVVFVYGLVTSSQFGSYFQDIGVGMTVVLYAWGVSLVSVGLAYSVLYKKKKVLSVASIVLSLVGALSVYPIIHYELSGAVPLEHFVFACTLGIAGGFVCGWNEFDRSWEVLGGTLLIIAGYVPLVIVYREIVGENTPAITAGSLLSGFVLYGLSMVVFGVLVIKTEQDTRTIGLSVLIIHIAAYGISFFYFRELVSVPLEWSLVPFAGAVVCVLTPRFERTGVLDEYLNEIRSRISDAEGALADRDLPVAVEHAEKAVESAEDARDYASDSEPDRVDEVDEILDEALVLRESISTQNGARELLLEARESREQGRREEALDTCEEAIETAETALERAKDAAVQTEAVEDVLSTAKELRTEIEKESEIADDLDDIRDSIDTAESLVSEGSPEEATQHLDEVTETLADLRDRASNQGFDGLVERADDLQERCESLKEEAEAAVAAESGEPQPPEKVPTGPDATVDYDSLKKGECVGRGGDADVYRATLDGTDTTVALKEPRFSGTLHTDVVERFMNEAETWQKLDDHDHIVDVINYGSEPLPWIALEYMDGGNMSARMEEMEMKQAVWTALCVVRGVRHAHRHGITHLDLKPENILFRETDNDQYDVPKVADWGLAKVLLEHSKSMEGLTPQYAAPEQFDSDRYGKPDHETDIYQLGAVFYELFTGRPPFEGGHMKIMDSVKNKEPTPPSDANPDLPEELDEVLLTALRKDKKERYDSVVYLRDAVRDLHESL